MFQVNTMNKKSKTLKEIAKEIDSYLKKFETDSKINRPRKGGDGRKYRAFGNAGATASHDAVLVTYIQYMRGLGVHRLSKEEAVIYLDWLKAGNVGRHYDALADHRKTKIDRKEQGSKKQIT